MCKVSKHCLIFKKTYRNLLKYMDRIYPCKQKQAANRGKNTLILLVKKKLGYIVFGRQQGGLLTPVWEEFNRKRREFLRSAFRNTLARSRAFSVVVMGVGIS